MATEHVLYQKDNGVGIITLNRPEKLNALHWGMNQAIAEYCNEIKQDDEVKVVILTGKGRAFCAGTDLRAEGSTGIAENQGNVPTAAARDVARYASRPNALDRLISWGMTSIPKPTICAMNGVAVGLGSELTLHCDIRIAAESARWGQVFVLRGWVPDTGAGTYLLPRIVGLSKALELVCSGRIIDAQEMLRIGLVEQVVPDDQLMDKALEMAANLTKGAPLAVRMAKELIYRSLERNIEEHLMANGSAFRMLSASEDHAEGVKAFLEKREPRWKGR